MLPSLRPLIAEILVNSAPVSDDPGAWLGRLFGAETLYWCDNQELKGFGTREELADEVEALREQLAMIYDIVMNAPGKPGKVASAILDTYH